MDAADEEYRSRRHGDMSTRSIDKDQCCSPPAVQAQAASASERMVSHDTTPPSANSTAQTNIAVRYPAENSAGERVVAAAEADGDRQGGDGEQLAARATALFTPLATPTSASGAELRTVAVSGATVMAMPRPCSSVPGSTSTT